MPSTINASTASTTGLVQTADASGILQLQSDGVTGLSIQSGGKVVLPSTTLSTASAGTLEYNGGIPYFTPLGTQRGVVPGQQMYVLNSTVAGANATGNQSILGLASGATLTSSTIYQCEYFFSLSKSAGTTSHTLSINFGGTATFNNFNTWVNYVYAATGALPQGSASCAIGSYNGVSGIAGTGAITTAATSYFVRGTAIVSVNAGGTILPQYSLSTAPGGAYTTNIGSYMLIYPIGAAGSNVSVGTWA